MKLLSTGNPKVLKGMAQGYNTYILHLAPASLSGYNTCPKATEGCKAACLNTAGRGGMFKRGETTNTIQQARIRKTKYFYENRSAFMVDLVADIELAIKQSARLDLVPVFRLNGTSDLSWEKYSVVRRGVEYSNIFMAFPEVQFYDYTKHPSRKLDGKTAGNYDLTYSFSALTPKTISIKGLSNTANQRTAVVFLNRSDIPSEFRGWPVVDGDDTDVRHIEPAGVVVALYAKGKARSDATGFVQIKGRDY